MIVNDKIKFERQRTDPNVLVKVSVTLMIVTLNAVQNEVVTPLWKQGSSFGFQAYPNFAKYIPKNYFKAFIHAFPLMWADCS